MAIFRGTLELINKNGVDTAVYKIYRGADDIIEDFSVIHEIAGVGAVDEDGAIYPTFGEALAGKAYIFKAFYKVDNYTLV